MSRIVTFYSYKGGVGRTFALANTAVLLARRGKRVLIMDWDLEAPGLNQYFRPYIPPDAVPEQGLIHLLHAAAETPTADWRPYLAEAHISGVETISLLFSGDQAGDYVERVQGFSWPRFFEQRQGGTVLERWRSEWKASYDFVLVDSRTGITDSGGVCTILLPDILVLVFAANAQSFGRGKQILVGIQQARRKLAVRRPPLAILPLPGRFDGRDEVDEAQRWLDNFATELKPFYDDWLPAKFHPRQILELTKIPYITKCSFGEPLPVVTQGVSDPDGPGFYLENVARLIVSDFHEAARIIAPETAAPADPAAIPNAGPQVAPTRLPHGLRHFLGREKEIAALDQFWADRSKRILTIVAWGGTGKTSLVAEWMARKSAANWPDCDRVFDWSFSLSDSPDHSASSAEAFIESALEFFGDPAFARGNASPWDKGARLAQLAGERRTLLVLDSLETLQHPPGTRGGELRSPAIAALLRGLSQRNAGLCVITTREPVADLAAFRETVAPELHLSGFSKAETIELLKSAGVRGSTADFETMADELNAHALSLSLLANYLVKAQQGDLRKRDRIQFGDADAQVHGGRAFKMIATYEAWFEEGGEECARALALLRILGLFDRPADAGCLNALRLQPVIPDLTEPLVGLSENHWNLTISLLADSHLVLPSKDRSAIDTHPIIREYFGTQLRQKNPNGWRLAHRRLYEYLKDKAEYQPESIDGLRPLYDAVTHGCLAQLHQKACDEVFYERIRRGNKRFSWTRLGAFDLELKALASFFTEPWRRPSALLTESDQAWLLNEVSFSLRALGRVREALDPMRAALAMRTAEANTKEAAIAAANLSELQLASGDLSAAIGTAEAAVRFADRHDDIFQRQSARLVLADALHQSGRMGEALTRFREVEALERKDPQDYSLSYWAVGFRYCDWLLAEPERAAWRSFAVQQLAGQPADPSVAQHLVTCRDVEQRTGQALKKAAHREIALLDSALNRLSYGRATLYTTLLKNAGSKTLNTGSDAAHRLLASALDELRRSGSRDEVPRALLSNAWLETVLGDDGSARKSLDEAASIAERGPMSLLLADVHLHRARLFRDADELKKAATLVRSIGYNRRLKELEDAERHAKSW